MVELDKINEEDKTTINELISNHYRYTRSAVARKILDNFEREFKNFVKVMPLEYKRVLDGQKVEKELELSEASDG